MNNRYCKSADSVQPEFNTKRNEHVNPTCGDSWVDDDIPVKDDTSPREDVLNDWEDFDTSTIIVEPTASPVTDTEVPATLVKTEEPVIAVTKDTKAKAIMANVEEKDNADTKAKCPYG